MNGEDEPADRKDPYWDQRQRDLSINTNGETLTINEIKFVERFLNYDYGSCTRMGSC